MTTPVLSTVMVGFTAGAELFTRRSRERRGERAFTYAQLPRSRELDEGFG
jgi:hypothetical protein